MKREALLGGIAISLISGCAPSSEKIQSQYVSPETYANYDCQQIGVEFGRLSRRAEELGAVVDKQAENDQAQAFVGIVIFWPALFFLEGGETQQTMEYSRLKGEMETLEKVALEKGCGTDIRHIAESATSGPVVATNPQKLEALKVLYRDGVITEEEYLKRRQELTEAQAKQELAALEREKAAAAAAAAAKAQGAAVAPAKIKVALLQSSLDPYLAHQGSTANAWGRIEDVEREMVDQITKQIRFDDRIELTFSASDPDYSGHPVESRSKELWSGVFEKKLVESVAYQVADDLNADLVILFYWGMRQTTTTIDLYVVDAKQRRVYRRKGKGLRLTHLDQLLKDALENAMRHRAI